MYLQCVNETPRQEVIQLKSPISAKFGTNVRFIKKMIVAKKVGENILVSSS